MIHGYVPTDNPKSNWKDIIKNEQDYQNVLKSGMFWVWFDGYEKEIEEFLKGEKEKNESN